MHKKPDAQRWKISCAVLDGRDLDYSGLTY